MNMLGRWISVSVVALAFGFPASARAGLIFETVSDPVEAESWYQAFHLHTRKLFENVGVALVALDGDLGSALKDPAWDIVSDGTTRGEFVGQIISTNVARASGTMTTDLIWNQHFAGDMQDQSFLLTLFAWDNRFQSIQTAAAIWDGTRWTFGAAPGVTWEEFDALGGVTGIPAPSAALLGMLGLGLVGGLARRWR